MLLLLLAAVATIKPYVVPTFYKDLLCDRGIGSDKEHLLKDFVMLVHNKYLYFFYKDVRVRMKLPKVSSSVALNKF